MLSTLIGFLGAQIGPALAKSVVASLSKLNKADKRFARVNSLIDTGSTAVEAFSKVFGRDFYTAVSEWIAPKPDWSYEAARKDYIQLEIVGSGAKSIYQTLRDELNVNLDQIVHVYSRKDENVHNYFLGAFREWMERYRSLVGEDDDATKTFKTIESLLDGTRKNFLDAFKLLQQTGLGTIGAMLLIKAALIASSTGIGLVMSIHIWLLGIPMLLVGIIAVSGVILLALSRVKLAASNARSISIAMAYKLLDRRSAATPKISNSSSNQ